MKILSLITIIVAISFSCSAQLNGEWYSFRSFGFAKYQVNDSMLIVISKVDSLHLKSAYVADTFRIAGKVKKDSVVYLLLEDKFKKIIVEKFSINKECNCMLTGYHVQDSAVTTADQQRKLIARDQSMTPLFRFYSKETMLSFKKLRPLSKASKDEFVKVLQSRYNGLTEKETVAKFTILANARPAELRKGNVENTALYSNGFSPFHLESSYEELLDKYATDKDVQDLISKIEKL
jgi:hypothetical protein